MLEVTSAAEEAALGVNFTDVYKSSDLYWYGRRLQLWDTVNP